MNKWVLTALVAIVGCSVVFLAFLYRMEPIPGELVFETVYQKLDRRYNRLLVRKQIRHVTHLISADVVEGEYCLLYFDTVADSLAITSITRFDEPDRGTFWFEAYVAELVDSLGYIYIMPRFNKIVVSDEVFEAATYSFDSTRFVGITFGATRDSELVPADVRLIESRRAVKRRICDQAYFDSLSLGLGRYENDSTFMTVRWRDSLKKVEAQVDGK